MKIFFFLLMIFLISCKEVDKKEDISIDEEFAFLKNNTDKENYLENIFRLDQEIRNGESSELLLKYGKNSKKLSAFRQKMDSIDNLNLLRIELYLEKFNYPSRDSMSEIAVITPWVVIHHSDIENRYKNFNTLYKAYQNKNLKAGQFQMFLERTYLMEYGIWPKFQNPYQPEEKINSLIKKLNLQP